MFLSKSAIRAFRLKFAVLLLQAPPLDGSTDMLGGGVSLADIDRADVAGFAVFPFIGLVYMSSAA
jgi:hypothetical protein